jgi:hypothetical protein
MFYFDLAPALSRKPWHVTRYPQPRHHKPDADTGGTALGWPTQPKLR